MTSWRYFRAATTSVLLLITGCGLAEYELKRELTAASRDKGLALVHFENLHAPGTDQTQITWAKFGGFDREGRLGTVQFNSMVESSPKGDQLVGLIYRDIAASRDIYISDLVVADLKGNVLFRRNGIRSLDAVAISPDNRKLAFQRNDRLGYLSMPTGDEVTLTSKSSRRGTCCSSIGWSPAADRIVYESGGQILVYDFSTQTSSFLVEGHSPTWSPNGSWIAYRTSVDQPMLIAPSGSGARTLLNGRSTIGSLRWSPDSRYVLFADRRGQTFFSTLFGALALTGALNGRLGVIRISDGWEVTLGTAIAFPWDYVWVCTGAGQAP